MNRTYRLVWSRAQNAWVPVARPPAAGQVGSRAFRGDAATALSLAFMRGASRPLGGQVTR